MAWAIRSLGDASARIRGAFRQYLPGTDSALKSNFVTVTAKVLALISHEFELRMAYLSKQMFLTSATGSFLVLHASDLGIFRKPNSAARGTIIGEGRSNFTYPAGVRFVSGAVTYVSTAPATASQSGVVNFVVEAEVRGAVSNRDADGVLALADPALWPDISTSFYVDADGLGGGADEEDYEALRARALHRKRNPPGGGKLTDYEQIALSVPGVVKAWAFRRPLAPGYIALFFLFDKRPNLIPTPGDVLIVQAAIDASRLIRIDDNVVVAPTPRPIDITIHNLLNDSSDMRASIADNVTAMFRVKCKPGISGDTFTVSRSWIGEEISKAAGEDSHILAWPLNDVVLTNGEFPVLGVVTYGA